MSWEWPCNSKEITIDHLKKMIDHYEKENNTKVNKTELMDFMIWMVSVYTPKIDI